MLRVGIGLLVLALGPVAMHRAVPGAVGLGSVALAQIQAGDAMLVAEVERLVEAYGPAVWDGWEPQPILLRAREREYLFAHPNPPSDFAPLPETYELATEMYPLLRPHVLDGHITPAPIATAWLVGDRWGVAIPTMDVFQQAIDEALGAGVVLLDRPSYVRALIHETFHAFQLDTLGGPGALGPRQEPVDERAVLAALAATEDLDAWHAQQGSALADAIQAETHAEAAIAADSFLRLRRTWRAVAAASTPAYERQVEWIEGLARYADTRLFVGFLRDCETGSSSAVPCAGAVAYPPSHEVWSELMAQLRDPASIPGSIRDRYYLLGAAQGFVLDRLMPDWHERALPGREAIEDLLAEAVRASLPDAR